MSLPLIRALAWAGAAIALAALFCAGAALLEGAPPGGFMVSALTAGFLAGLGLAGTSGDIGRARAQDALNLALYGWAVLPLLAAAPFMAVGAGAGAGVFEAYSALTTTGASVIDLAGAPASLLLWRALLQALGGFATVLLAATALAALDAGPGLRRSTFLTIHKEDWFENFGPAARRIGGVYVGLITVGALALMVTGTEPFEALCLALSALSTGGMIPGEGPLSSYASGPGLALIAALCLVGAWNMAALYDIAARRRPGRLSGDLRAMGFAAAIAAVLASAAAGLAVLPEAGLDSVFAVTTAGFTVSAQSPVPSLVLVILALMGGSALSTAGGLKAPRVLLLVRRAGRELEILAHPSGAGGVRFAGRPVGDDGLETVWAYALAYIAALALGALALSLSGEALDVAWRMAGAALANAGPTAGADYAGLAFSGKGAVITLMVLGRLEVLIAVAALAQLLRRR